MRGFILRRMLHALFVMLAISLVVFLITRMSGDPVSLMLPQGNPSVEDVQRVRGRLGLDRPLHEQYWIFLRGALQGDFGDSWRYRTAALPLVLERLPATLELAAGALAVAVLIGIPAGILSAIRRGGIVDMLARIFALCGVSFPSFWFGIVLILLISVRLQWLPASGRGGIEHLVLPAITLGSGLAAVLMRLLRASMLEVLGSDYVLTAKAKGLRGSTVVMRHALRNALIPVVTVLGIQFGALLGGAVVVEVVFAWPGMGQLVVQAIQQRDYAVVQATVVLLAALFVFISVLVDVSYLLLDPRIKLS